MGLLFSETSMMTRNHGAMAQAISELPRLSCEDLSHETGRAVGSYLRSEHPDAETQQRLVSAVKGIALATRTMLNYVVSESGYGEAEAEEGEPPRLYRLFEPVILRQGIEKHDAVDRAITGVLGAMTCTKALSDGSLTVYPFRIDTGFRIATSRYSLDLIPEVVRTEHRSPRDNEYDQHEIVYNLHFASFDVVE